MAMCRTLERFNFLSHLRIPQDCRSTWMCPKEWSWVWIAKLGVVPVLFRGRNLLVQFRSSCWLKPTQLGACSFKFRMHRSNYGLLHPSEAGDARDLPSRPGAIGLMIWIWWLNPMALPGSTLGRLRWSVGAGRKHGIWEVRISLSHTPKSPDWKIDLILYKWMHIEDFRSHSKWKGELWELHSGKCTIFVSVNHCGTDPGTSCSALAIFLILSAAVGREVSTTIVYEVQPAWKKKTTRFMGSPHRFPHKIPFDHNPFNWT